MLTLYAFKNSICTQKAFINLFAAGPYNRTPSE